MKGDSMSELYKEAIAQYQVVSLLKKALKKEEGRLETTLSCLNKDELMNYVDYIEQEESHVPVRSWQKYKEK